jgi:hypothetical protein
VRRAKLEARTYLTAAQAALQYPSCACFEIAATRIREAVAVYQKIRSSESEIASLSQKAEKLENVAGELRGAGRCSALERSTTRAAKLNRNPKPAQQRDCNAELEHFRTIEERGNKLDAQRVEISAIRARSAALRFERALGVMAP